MNLNLNADRFSGKHFVSIYNKYRPEPPREILHQCLQYLGKVKADLILDLGCGTGLSTRILSDYSQKIIGVEPSEAMLSIARSETNEKHISYLQAFSNEIPIQAQSADIITCSQSFHWMEPKSTLKEINRILKPDGVLLIYDVIWPPSVSYEYEQAYRELFDKVSELTEALPEPIAHRWNKAGHIKNVEQSNFFDYVKESYFHKSESFNKETFTGIALSQGGLEALLKRGFSEKEIGVTRFKEKIASRSSVNNEILTYNYRVIFGVRRT